MSDEVVDDKYIAMLKDLGQKRYIHDRLNGQVSDLKKDLDRTVIKVHEEFEEAKLGSMKVTFEVVDPITQEKIERYINFVPSEKDYGKVQDKAAFIAWCEANNRPDLIKTDVSKKDMDNFVRDCLDDGRPLPDGLGFYTKKTIGQRAA